jgi:hypothetical protein
MSKEKGWLVLSRKELEEMSKTIDGKRKYSCGVFYVETWDNCNKKNEDGYHFHLRS